jgi:hypothetical protein
MAMNRNMRPLSAKKSQSMEGGKPLNGFVIPAALSTGLKAGVTEKSGRSD